MLLVIKGTCEVVEERCKDIHDWFVLIPAKWKDRCVDPHYDDFHLSKAKLLDLMLSLAAMESIDGRTVAPIVLPRSCCRLDNVFVL